MDFLRTRIWKEVQSRVASATIAVQHVPRTNGTPLQCSSLQNDRGNWYVSKYARDAIAYYCIRLSYDEVDDDINAYTLIASGSLIQKARSRCHLTSTISAKATASECCPRDLIVQGVDAPLCTSEIANILGTLDCIVEGLQIASGMSVQPVPPLLNLAILRSAETF